MLIGVCGYTFAIGSLSSILSSLDSRQAKLKEKTGILNGINSEYFLSTELFRRLMKAVKYDHSRNQMDKFEFLKELPQSLKLELSYIMHQHLIDKIPFFQHQPRQFIAYIGPLLRQLKILKGEYIYERGDPIDDIFFIVKGNVGFVLKKMRDAIYLIVEEGKYLLFD